MLSISPRSSAPASPAGRPPHQEAFVAMITLKLKRSHRSICCKASRRSSPMTPEEYWKRIEEEEAVGFRMPGEAAGRALRFQLWCRQQRRERRRRILRFVAGGALSGLVAALLIASVVLVRGVKPDDQVASAPPAPADEPADPRVGGQSVVEPPSDPGGVAAGNVARPATR